LTSCSGGANQAATGFEVAKDGDGASSAGSTNTVAIVVGVCVAVIIIIALIAIIVFLKRNRQDDVPAAVVVVPVDPSGKLEEKVADSLKAALDQYREASTRADFVSAIKLLTKAIRNGTGSEVSQVGKRDLTSIAGEFHNKVGDEVWKELRQLFLALLKEYNERMGNAPLADNRLAQVEPMHQHDAAV
jgi:hypothetical protein